MYVQRKTSTSRGEMTSHIATLKTPEEDGEEEEEEGTESLAAAEAVC